MNLYEATNYFLGEEDDSVITNLIKKIVSIVKLPSKEDIKKWISDHADEFVKANELYNKAVVMKESAVTEGFFDFLKGVNKNTLIMLALIALSALSGNAHASIADLENAAADIVKGMSVIRVDQTDKRAGYTVDFVHGAKGEHYKQVLGGVDKAAIQKVKDLAKEQGYDEQTAINVIHYMLADDMMKDKTKLQKRLDGLTGKEFERLVKGSIK